MKELIIEDKIDVNARDEKGRVKPSAVFTLFQNAASVHADKLGVGYDDLIEKDIIWMLVRCRYDLIENPALGEKVDVKTYPLPPRGVDFDREYVISDKRGNKLVKGTSKWCLCNYKTRKLLIRGEVKYNIDVFSDDRQYDKGLKKLADFSTDGFSEFTARTFYTDLDHNGHVNNTRYLDFILNAIAADLGERRIEYLEIDYISEMKANAEFTVYYKNTGDVFLVKGISEQKEVFRAEVGIK